jgi:hypothetical protein
MVLPLTGKTGSTTLLHTEEEQLHKRVQNL